MVMFTYFLQLKVKQRIHSNFQPHQRYYHHFFNTSNPYYTKWEIIPLPAICSPPPPQTDACSTTHTLCEWWRRSLLILYYSNIQSCVWLTCIDRRLKFHTTEHHTHMHTNYKTSSNLQLQDKTCYKKRGFILALCSNCPQMVYVLLSISLSS